MADLPSIPRVGLGARREARPSVGETHITSLVVQAQPSAVPRVAAAIDGLPDAEVHIADPRGKLVVSLETESLHQVTEQVDRIAALAGVVTATLVYHQIEDSETLDHPVDASAA